MKPFNPRSAFLNRRTHRLIAFVCAVSLSFSSVLLAQQTASPAPSQDMTETANTTAPEAAPKIPNDQLDALVAPIALYPDPLLAQILAASTYPLEIVQLEQWLKRNPNLKDKALADEVAKQPWDPSIQAMAIFPDVVTRLSANVAWATNLGNAFLAQQQDVMDAVQRMRAKAQSTGALKTTEQQKVETETVEGGQEAIVIEPANPQYIYVPSYDPEVVYGPPGTYPYPAYYYPGYVPGMGWHLAQDSYWAQRGQTIGAIAIGATATSTLTTTTISIETTSTISIVASKAENGSIMRSIVVALLTETEIRLTSTAAALDNSRPAQLTGAAVRQVSAVARVLPEEQAIDPVAEELEISEPAIVPAADPELDAVSAM
jgi:hypothetical protein